MQSVFSGHTRMIGVDGSIHPGMLPGEFAADAVNRSFRGGVSATRPPYRTIELVFEDKEDEEVFRRGSVQEVAPYEKQFIGRSASLIVCCHDRILQFRVVGRQAFCRRLYKGTDPEVMGASIAVGGGRLYWQNGYQRPIGWDGSNDAYIVKDGEDRMPIGVHIAYVGGRAAVITHDGYTLIGDYIYGNGVKDNDGMEIFTEIHYTNDLGAIAPPGAIGDVCGAIQVPVISNTTLEPQLLVMGEKGAFTLDLGGLRSEWINKDIMKPILRNTGSTSGRSLLAAHSDVFFCSTQGGVESLRWNRRRVDNDWSELSVSSEVRKYMLMTPPHHRRWTDSVFHNNRIMFTTGITVKVNPFGGAHHYGEGLVVLDVARGSTVNESSGFQWDGMWTGLNISGLANLVVDGHSRAFAVSHDEDGVNRIYELMPDGSGDDEYDGKTSKIVSFYDTPYMFTPRGPESIANGFMLTKLVSAKAYVEDIGNGSKIEIKFRNAMFPNWSDTISTNTVGCFVDQLPQSTEDISQITHPFAKVSSGEPKNTCGDSPSRVGLGFQFRVLCEGRASVPYFVAEATVEKDSSFRVSCDDSCKSVNMLDTIDQYFSYKVCPRPQKQSEQ